MTVRNKIRRKNCIDYFINITLNVFSIGTIVCLFGILSTSLIAQPVGEGKSKFIGNIIGNAYSIPSNFPTYWNQVTAENAGKWGSVETSAGNYNWSQLDLIYNYAVAKGFPYKHHCLVWGQQQPGFLSSMDSAAQYQEVENWIKATGERYPLADMVDVVNEPLHAQPVYKNALGGSGATGWDWVIKTFELARKYWPSTTKLLINEYNILNSSTSANSYVQIINLLKDRGLIDGVGIQCHSGEVVGPSTTTLQSNLNIIKSAGLPIYISEFDINEANDNLQLQKYQSIFPVLFEDPGVAGITFWGYIQGAIWQTSAYLLDNRNAKRPAMDWLITYMKSPFAPKLDYPVAASDVELNLKLSWHPSDSAATYQVQISTTKSFSTIDIDTTVTDTTFQPAGLQESTTYYWRVNASNDKGTSLYSSIGYFITKQITDLSESKIIPNEYFLSQNFPNPFNPTTQITYSVPQSGYVSLKVYNLLGKEVANLFEGRKDAGYYLINFNAEGLASGVYIYQLKSGNFTESKKLMLLK